MEILAKDLHKFPMTITKLLREIRHLDKLSVLSMNEIKLEEERLLDDFLHYNNFLAQKKREQQVIVQQQKEQERAVALAAAAAMAVASTTEGQEEAVPQQSEQDVPSSSSSNNMPEAEATQTLTPSRVSPSKVLSPKAAPRSPSLASTSATTTAATPNKTDATINVSLTIDVDTTTIAEIVASASSPTANEDPLAPFIARWEAINHKRQKIMKQLEKHVQTTQRIYNLVDTNITTLDTATKPIHHLFPFPDEVSTAQQMSSLLLVVI